MKTVHKFTFDVDDLFVLRMPCHAKILHVECQGRQPCVWALVDTDQPIVASTFALTGTGHPVQDGVQYVATFQQPPFVWHLWQI